MYCLKPSRKIMLFITINALTLVMLTLIVTTASSSQRSYPPDPDKLIIDYWHRSDKVNKPPPVIADWQDFDFAMVLTARGRFINNNGAEGILQRIASVSALSGLPYWSTSRQRWTTFIDRSQALSGPARRETRNDFTLDELEIGENLFYSQDQQTTAGTIIYRFTIREKSTDQVTITMENASPIRFLGIPVMAAGATQYMLNFRQLTDNHWGYHGQAGVKRGLHELLPGRKASLANRAAAVFYYFAATPDHKKSIWLKKNGQLRIINEKTELKRN